MKAGNYQPDARTFQRRLRHWYDANRRDLPWRKTRDPYRVWLSEIMLQQTRVNAVLDHYRRFLERFPNIEALAAAPLASVLAAWSGLGYYRRARMLHQAAQNVVQGNGAQFPSTSKELLSLPGIGRYTAAAIASIAFDESIAVVDGNVERVLDRLLGRKLNQMEVWAEAQSLLPPDRPGDFNQAMMELGATVCTPRAPQCLICPVNELCATRGEGSFEKKSSKQTKREVHYALDLRKERVLLVQRSKDSSLMPSMWELPELQPESNGAKIAFTLRHSITVTDYVVRVSHQRFPKSREGKWVRLEALPDLPLTGLARKILKAAKAM